MNKTLLVSKLHRINVTEVELDYDNKVVLSNLTFTDTYDLHEAIMRNIQKQFKVIYDESTDTKQ